MTHLRPYLASACWTTAALPRSRTTTAMTLIEVCVALAVATFALMVLLGVLSGTVVNGRRASDESTAALIQQRLLADLRSQPFDNIHLSDDDTVIINLSVLNSNLPPVQYTQSGEPGTGTPYFRAYLTSQPSSNFADLAAVSITVVFPVTTTTPTSNRLHTWVARRQ